MMVLIDTWWNVNFLYSLIVKLICIVLIDTWWNVNSGVWTIGYGHTGF